MGNKGSKAKSGDGSEQPEGTNVVGVAKEAGEAVVAGTVAVGKDFVDATKANLKEAGADLKETGEMLAGLTVDAAKGTAALGSKAVAGAQEGMHSAAGVVKDPAGAAESVVATGKAAGAAATGADNKGAAGGVAGEAKKAATSVVHTAEAVGKEAVHEAADVTKELGHGVQAGAKDVTATAAKVGGVAVDGAVAVEKAVIGAVP